MRRPISLKIFGIAIALLVLMIVVTFVSSRHMRLVGEELALLSDIYIRLDQQMADLRARSYREVLAMERVLSRQPKGAPGDAQAQAVLAQAGGCDDDAVRAALREARQQYPDRGDRQMLGYRVTRLCTNLRLAEANTLLSQALALQQVRSDPDEVARFANIRAELANITPARERFHASFEKYLAQRRAADAGALAAAQEQIDERRRETLRPINAVSQLVTAGTRQSAERTKTLERKTQWLNWSITLVATALGLLFAGVITRSLVRPVRELLTLTKAVRTGNLDVTIPIKTADEIGQLADSLNHMVGELKQKELIKAIFGRYVDPRIVQALLLEQQGAAPRGDRRVMSIFFSDIEGFTGICERLTPTVAVRLLNEYFTTVSRPIRAEQGIIDKYIGDSVMAFWGPPFTAESEQAVLACRAALAQQARIPELQAKLPELLGFRTNVPVIRVRMGIATGDVMVGGIGSEDARSYTVIGDTANLASRLEGASKQYHTLILICAETRRLAGDAIEAREIDAIRVVGQSAPVRVYELLGAKGDISLEMDELRMHYESGLAFYRAGQWPQAMEAFERCLKLKRDDGPAQLFVERVRLLAERPPALPWDGVWTLTQK